MNTNALENFANVTRKELIEQINARLYAMLAPESIARRESPAAIKKLEADLQKYGRSQILERIAYTWFNRFCALRFMDVHGYTSPKVISPGANSTIPEILAAAKEDDLDPEIIPEKFRQRILALLSGSYTSPAPEADAYRLLLVLACNHLGKSLPFMFDSLEDYAELLLPDDLLSKRSIPAKFIEALNESNCADAEIIGWLYQFYNSEKKAQIDKAAGKIRSADIPSATQLFTPDWIVRFLTENSLGRLWLLNNPHSNLKHLMPFYVSAQDDTFLKIASPEEIKILDPACGSGHILTYAFDLLYKIYEEEGFSPTEISGKILKNNLYGLEIDPRAGALAAFALCMKARAKDKHFFKRAIIPNILVFENISISAEERQNYLSFIGRDLLNASFTKTIAPFEEAQNFGFLIRPQINDLINLQEKLAQIDFGRNILLEAIHKKALKILQMAAYLVQNYHLIIANPPYMGAKKINKALAQFASKNYPASKINTFAMFMERALDLVLKNGYCAMITMESWMFISSFETLRLQILAQNTIIALAHLGTRAFESISGERVSTTAFVIQKTEQPEFKGNYFYLVDYKSSAEKEQNLLKIIQNPTSPLFYQANSANFKKIPGAPLSYWVSEKTQQSFTNRLLLNQTDPARQGLATGDNPQFLRLWHEVDFNNIAFNLNASQEANATGKKWFPYNKGGRSRKWYGNQEYIINWQNDGAEIKNFAPAVIRNPSYYFQPSLSWSKVSSKNIALRAYPAGFIFDVAGCSIFPTQYPPHLYLAFINSNACGQILKALSSPSNINFEIGNINNLPLPTNLSDQDLNHLSQIVEKNIAIAKADWDSFETSWNFTTLPILDPKFRQPTLEATYQALRAHWRQITLEAQKLAEENNQFFIQAFNFQDELSPNVPLPQISLNCNPYYRYKANNNEEKLEASLLSDTIRELISYAVGCIFGRYSLDTPGLIMASQNDSQPATSFQPLKDNVLLLNDKSLMGLFREFMRQTFGRDHIGENLSFISSVLTKAIDKYFLNDFYTDHLKLYQNRPIYWLFQSPAANFSALIYLHRYNKDTINAVLAKLRAYRNQLDAELEYLSQNQAQSLKETNALQKAITDLNNYERDTLYPLATQKIELNLDDGVKQNYLKLGKALKQI